MSRSSKGIVLVTSVALAILCWSTYRQRENVASFAPLLGGATVEHVSPGGDLYLRCKDGSLVKAGMPRLHRDQIVFSRVAKHP